MNEKVIQRFWANVQIQKDGHWIWIGNKIPRGYGKMMVDKLDYQALRLSWAIAHNLEYNDFDHLIIRKLCSVKMCVNPAHLAAAYKIKE